MAKPATQPRINISHTLAGISDPARALHSVDLTALSDMSPEELALFQEVWAAITPSRRRALLNEMIDWAEDRVDVSFCRIFQWLTGDEDSWVRAQAINGLWEEEDVRLIEPLIRLLRTDPAPEVRAAAAQSLGAYLLLGELEDLDATLAAAVERALQDAYQVQEETQVRRRILESLAYSAATNIPSLIRQAYEEDDEGMRISAVFAMGRSADPRWRDIVLAELVSTDTVMQFEAARASGELELAEAVPDLIDLLDDEDIDLRDTAIWALGRIGGPEARRALRACADSGDEDLVDAAQEALEELNFLSGEDLPTFMFEFDATDES